MNQFIMENLDLNLNLEYLFTLIKRLISLNHNFQKKEKKIYSQIFHILIINIKSFLNESIKQTKEAIKRSKVRIKFMGYLRFFASEVETQSLDNKEKRFEYYSKFHSHILKLSKICNDLNIINFIQEEVQEKSKDIFNCLLGCIILDIKNAKNSKKTEVISALLKHLGPLCKNVKFIFEEFDCLEIYDQIHEEMMECVDFSIEIYSRIEKDGFRIEDFLDQMKMIEYLISKNKLFFEDVIKQIMPKDPKIVYKFSHELIKNFIEFFFDNYFRESTEKKLEVF